VQTGVYSWSFPQLLVGLLVEGKTIHRTTIAM